MGKEIEGKSVVKEQTQGGREKEEGDKLTGIVVVVVFLL